ncbi:MAG: DNA replication/repair protein RecF [Oscillospiraceae bacterium]|jgi:DNA replication and repair protein RecF|nr:DNA replication/repair protein RecF [Oscillospiraceae bacterium]
MIESVSLSDFRNYSSFSADFSPGLNIIRGQNAQGKTNLLEALHLLASARSFRSARDRDMLRFGAEGGFVRGVVVLPDGRRSELEARLFARKRRESFRNGAKLRRASDFTGTLSAVLFTPEDLELVRGGAETRRRMLDLCISQLRPRYAGALSDFNRLYAHKNRILRDFRENPSLLPPLRDFNAGLSETGAALIYYRAAFILKLRERARAVHLECSGSAEELSLTYKTVRGVDAENPDRRTILDAILTRQEELYDAELSSGQCLVGAQRDDVEITINGVAARNFASQGQARTAALSMKFAERDLMSEDTGRAPLLLLDDVLSELDAARRAYVLERIGGGQAFITCCEPIEAESLSGARLLEIDGGSLVSCISTFPAEP